MGRGVVDKVRPGDAKTKWPSAGAGQSSTTRHVATLRRCTRHAICCRARAGSSSCPARAEHGATHAYTTRQHGSHRDTDRQVVVQLCPRFRVVAVTHGGRGQHTHSTRRGVTAASRCGLGRAAVGRQSPRLRCGHCAAWLRSRRHTHVCRRTRRCVRLAPPVVCDGLEIQNTKGRSARAEWQRYSDCGGAARRAQVRSIQLRVEESLCRQLLLMKVLLGSLPVDVH